MKQITEDYCNFEIAKLLKEKGFDEICSYEWGVPDIDKGYVLQKWVINNGQIRNSDLIDGAYTAPTHQMALKWLREVHKLDIDVSIEYKNSKKVYYYSILEKTVIRDIDCLHSETNFDSYEQAVEASLLYVLKKLI